VVGGEALIGTRIERMVRIYTDWGDGIGYNWVLEILGLKEDIISL
jgi:hypothetical protein